MNTKQLPPLKSLPAFVATAEYLSFSKAADALFVTHSAVSQSIKTLETFLNTKLFLREGGKVHLTSQGKQYYRTINNALNIIQTATTQLSQKQTHVLTVNVMTTLAMRWLIPRLPNFQTRYPEIDLRLSTLTTIDFDHDQVDLAILYGHEDDWPGLKIERLFNDHLVLVASPALRINAKNIERIITRFKCIYVNSGLRQYDWQTWCNAMNFKQPKKNNRIYFSSSAQGLQAVVSGMGIMVTHAPFIEDDLHSGQLVKLGKDVALTKKIYCVCPPNNRPLPNISHFIDWIVAKAKRGMHC